jgi:hypothetical protein
MQITPSEMYFNAVIVGKKSIPAKTSPDVAEPPPPSARSRSVPVSRPAVSKTAVQKTQRPKPTQAGVKRPPTPVDKRPNAGTIISSAGITPQHLFSDSPMTNEDMAGKW